MTRSPDGTSILAFWEPTTTAVSIDVASGDYQEVDWPLTNRPAWQRKAP